MYVMLERFFELDLETQSAMIAEWVKIIGAGVAFWIGITRYREGLTQYKSAQNWKRSEFLAIQVKDFEADEKIHAVLMLLDWTSTPPGGFSGVEASIRDAFDRFFDALGRLQNFVDLELIDGEQVDHYVGYWIESVAKVRPQHGDKLPVLAHAFLCTWEFKLAMKMFQHHGYFRQIDKEKETAVVAEVSSWPPSLRGATQSSGDN